MQSVKDIGFAHAAVKVKEKQIGMCYAFYHPTPQGLPKPLGCRGVVWLITNQPSLLWTQCKVYCYERS